MSATAASATTPRPTSVRTVPGSGGGEDDLRARQARQDLVRADGVERGEPVEEWEDDAHDCSSQAVACTVKWLRYWPGRHTERAFDGPVHGLDGAEATRPGDGGQRQGGGLEKPAGPLDPDPPRRRRRA